MLREWEQKFDLDDQFVHVHVTDFHDGLKSDENLIIKII
jgi:hypothetical protein